jgi:DNA-binding MarR family transcriptional regulator
LNNLDNDLLVLIYDVARMIRRRADQMARQKGTTRAQWVVLARLARQPGLSQAELANIAEVEPITMGRLIDRLEARGLVERRSDQKDRRLRRLHLTEKAKPLLDEIDAFRSEMNAFVLRGIDDDRRTSLRDALRQMKANIGEERACRAENRVAEAV